MFYYKLSLNKKFACLFYIFYLVHTFTSVKAAISLNKPMEYFVLSEDFPLKSNFEFVPPNNRLILIAKLITYKLTEQQKNDLTKSFLSTILMLSILLTLLKVVYKS